MFPFNANTPLAEQASVLIRRAPDAVFDFIGERFFSNYPRWSPEVLELQQIGSGPVRLGTRARQVRIDLGHRSESTFVVTVFQPGSRICFEGDSSAYRCDYELKAMPARGSTLVRFGFEVLRMELYLRPFEGLIREAIRDGAERTVRNLKSLVEAERYERAA
jgi:hypothetical protein